MVLLILCMHSHVMAAMPNGMISNKKGKKFEKIEQASHIEPK